MVVLGIVSVEMVDLKANVNIDEDTLSLNFDKWKCYLFIRKPSYEESTYLHMYTLTSTCPYEHQTNNIITRLSKDTKVRVSE